MPIIGFGGGFGGGGTSYINGVVATSADLPTTVGDPPLDSVYLSKAGSGVWLINRKPAGLYCRTANNGNAADWTYLGAFPEVNADGNWELYNSTDPTKELKFDVSGVSTGTTRTLTVPDKSGTIMLQDDPIKHIVYNNSGAAIPKGKVVYLFGSQGQRTTIRLADNSSDTTSARTFGITAEAIADNSQGIVITEGVLEGVSTAGLADGTALWLGSNGNYISTRPTQPLHGVFIGVVVKGTSVGAGSIFVKVANGQELDEIHDVLISSPSANQVLSRNTGNTLWVNKTLTASDVGAFPASPTVYNITLPVNGSYSVPSGRYVEVNASTTYQFGSQNVSINLPSGTTGDVIFVSISLQPNVTAYVGGEIVANTDPVLGVGYRKYKFIRISNYWQLDGSFYHTHNAIDIANSTAAGRSLITAVNAEAQRIFLATFSYVANFSSLPATGSAQRAYITVDTGKVFAWDGTSYIEVAGTNNYPAFTAQTSAQITSAGEISSYGSALLNRGLNFDSSTGRFTAPISGVYCFTFTGSAQATYAPALTTVQFRKNSVEFSPNIKTTTSQYQVDLAPSYPAFDSLSVTANILLNAGEYVSVWLDTGGVASNAVFTGNLVG